MKQACFHCGESIPSGISLFVTIENIEQPMCCIGCQAIASTIVDNKLTDYYRYRTEPAKKGDELIPKELERNTLLDDDTLQDEFTFKNENFRETILTIDGISCVACAWLIEMQISKVVGITQIAVNATTQRGTIKWDNEQVHLSQIIKQIAKIGYQALPFKASTVERNNQQKSKTFIKRLGISGILMMQVMMIAVGLYFGAFSDMSAHNLVYLRWASFLLTLPIITYGAFPFYKGAFNALRVRRLSMDVPVSIAILLAFSASGWATISQQGEVYFESVSMFTFLLLIGKFLEFRARLRASEVSANLLKLVPMTATKIVDQKEKFVTAKSLEVNDAVLIKPGETVPADGKIIKGTTHCNEAMLSGEQIPVSKSLGDTVYAGTVNGDGNISIEVTQAVQHSFLNQLIRLSESSQAHKPKLAQLSDKIAQYFVAIILVTAIGTAIFWSQSQPEEAFWITLSVLVATCPCALSLATPTALTCATARLNRDGVMIKSSHVLETMPSVSAFAFDKTGTLTTGEFAIDKLTIFDPLESESNVLAITAGLESQSEHPLAKAFAQYRDHSLTIENIEVVGGHGIIGTIEGNEYKIGKPGWLLGNDQLAQTEDANCILVRDGHLIAAFYLTDQVRIDARTVINSLKSNHIQTLMLSGDNATGCNKVQQDLKLDTVYSNLTAKEKMTTLMSYQKNYTVGMIGDGVNDTPVFGAAHISIAMGSGTDVAKSGADVILLDNKLSTIQVLKSVSEKTKRIIKQNYLWAIGYNAIILPLAVSGFITPYIAVIGMSASSILVITNSLRLLKKSYK